MADNGLMMVAHGIRLVKPHKLAPAASAQVLTPSSSATTPIVIAPPPSSATVAAHPLMKQILTRNLSPGPVSTNVNQQANGINGTNSNSSSRSSTPSDDQPKSPISQVNVKDEPLLKSTVAKRLIKEEAEKKANGQNGNTTNGIDSSDDESDTSREKDGRNKNGNENDNTLQKILVSNVNIKREFRYLIHYINVGVSYNTSCFSHSAKHITIVYINREGLAPAKPAPYRYDIPRDVPQHPGYSKHAAIDAIRRHAFNFLPRDITMYFFKEKLVLAVFLCNVVIRSSNCSGRARRSSDKKHPVNQLSHTEKSSTLFGGGQAVSCFPFIMMHNSIIDA
uniref:HSF_DOMAIN domain-containing protein n=1 Tax=Heterorhabditis bacteriophora TaxID=37862 RepID=A0A1I7WXL2_HETBA